MPSHCQARFALPTSLSLALQGALREFSASELKAERAQMQALLEKFPTTLKQDREILSSMQRAGGHYFGTAGFPSCAVNGPNTDGHVARKLPCHIIAFWAHVDSPS